MASREQTYLKYLIQPCNSIFYDCILRFWPLFGWICQDRVHLFPANLFVVNGKAGNINFCRSINFQINCQILDLIVAFRTIESVNFELYFDIRLKFRNFWVKNFSGSTNGESPNRALDTIFVTCKLSIYVSICCILRLVVSMCLNYFSYRQVCDIFEYAVQE